MSKFVLKTEESSCAFMNVILYDGECAFTISDATEEIIAVSDLNDLNNIVSFPRMYYVEFARFLKANEDVYNFHRHLNLSLFLIFIKQNTA